MIFLAETTCEIFFFFDVQPSCSRGYFRRASLALVNSGVKIVLGVGDFCRRNLVTVELDVKTLEFSAENLGGAWSRSPAL